MKFLQFVILATFISASAFGMEQKSKASSRHPNKKNRQQRMAAFEAGNKSVSGGIAEDAQVRQANASPTSASSSEGSSSSPERSAQSSPSPLTQSTFNESPNSAVVASPTPAASSDPTTPSSVTPSSANRSFLNLSNSSTPDTTTPSSSGPGAASGAVVAMETPGLSMNQNFTNTALKGLAPVTTATPAATIAEPATPATASTQSDGVSADSLLAESNTASPATSDAITPLVSTHEIFDARRIEAENAPARQLDFNSAVTASAGSQEVKEADFTADATSMSRLPLSGEETPKLLTPISSAANSSAGSADVTSVTESSSPPATPLVVRPAPEAPETPFTPTPTPAASSGGQVDLPSFDLGQSAPEASADNVVASSTGSVINNHANASRSEIDTQPAQIKSNAPLESLNPISSAASSAPQATEAMVPATFAEVVATGTPAADNVIVEQPGVALTPSGNDVNAPSNSAEPAENRSRSASVVENKSEGATPGSAAAAPVTPAATNDESTTFISIIDEDLNPAGVGAKRVPSAPLEERKVLEELKERKGLEELLTSSDSLNARETVLNKAERTPLLPERRPASPEPTRRFAIDDDESMERSTGKTSAVAAAKAAAESVQSGASSVTPSVPAVTTVTSKAPQSSAASSSDPNDPDSRRIQQARADSVTPGEPETAPVGKLSPATLRHLSSDPDLGGGNGGNGRPPLDKNFLIRLWNSGSVGKALIITGGGALAGALAALTVYVCKALVKKEPKKIKKIRVTKPVVRQAHHEMEEIKPILSEEIQPRLAEELEQVIALLDEPLTNA